MRVIYIAGPYRGPEEIDVHFNIQQAEKNAAMFWKAGYVALCPHKNSAYFGGLVSDEIFLEGAMELMRRSDALFLPDNWIRSKGTCAERETAMEINLPIVGSVNEADILFRE